MSERTFRDRTARAKRIHPDKVAPTHINGTSTLYDKDGQVVLTWVKKTVAERRAELFRDEAFMALTDKLPRYAPVASPKHTSAELMSVYPLADFHLGMLAWKFETGGEDWDTKKAEELLVNWFKVAVDYAPSSGRAVLANLGDFLHWDGLDAVTPAHGNLLDADTRFAKLVRVAIRVLRQIIAMLLKKHGSLHVIMADDNHSPASEIWMREWLDVVYENDPRVTIERSADSYYCVEHGLTMTCFHHGHRRGIKDVDRVMAGKFSDVFGRTKFRYAHLAHLHSDEALETPLMKVERHRTLAPPDAYAGKGGWMSGRDAKVITYHRDLGEVHRITVNPDMVRAGGM